MDKELILRLWEESGHGTRAEDVVNIWNAAIKAASEIVRTNYDEQEPWLEVSDIEGLYIERSDLDGCVLEVRHKR